MSKVKEKEIDTTNEEVKSIKFPKKIVSEVMSLGDEYKPVNFSEFTRIAVKEKIAKEKKK